MRAQPEQQAPPVLRLRIRYAKRGRMRFTSHRDFSRAFERALVRASIPMAYSSGFNPHPRVSYAGASPTGAASEAEYLEIGLAEERGPDQVLRALDEALPDGLDIVDVVVSHGGALADQLEASRWRVRLPGVSKGAAARAVGLFLAAEQVPVSRMTKKGMREFDARGAVVSLAEVGDPVEECAILDMVLRTGSPAVRPDDVLAGLCEIGGLPDSQAALSQRLSQGPLDERTGTVGDPLALDRDSS